MGAEAVDDDVLQRRRAVEAPDAEVPQEPEGGRTEEMGSKFRREAVHRARPKEGREDGAPPFDEQALDAGSAQGGERRRDARAVRRGRVGGDDQGAPSNLHSTPIGDDGEQPWVLFEGATEGPRLPADEDNCLETLVFWASKRRVVAADGAGADEDGVVGAAEGARVGMPLRAAQVGAAIGVRDPTVEGHCNMHGNERAMHGSADASRFPAVRYASRRRLRGPPERDREW